MLTAETVHSIINYTSEDLTRLIQVTHRDHQLTNAKFLGINNVSQLVFSATQFNEEFNCDQQTKVFVYNDNGTIVAEY